MYERAMAFGPKTRSFRMTPSALAFALVTAASLTSSAALAQTTGGSTAPKKDATPSKPAATPAKENKGAKSANDNAAPPPATTTPASEEIKPAEPAAVDDHQEDLQAVYLSGDIGFTRADVGGLSDSTGFDKTGANGLLAGLGIGYRNRAFRFGARFRDASTTEYSLWSIMGEVGYGLKMRPLSPAFYVHAGYIFDTGVERGAISSKLPAGNVLTPDVDLNGVVVGAEVVASYWLTKFLRVGPFIGFDLTVLHRSQPPVPQSLFRVPDEVRNNALFGESGNGLGYMFNIGLRVTGDVGFDSGKHAEHAK